MEIFEYNTYLGDGESGWFKLLNIILPFVGIWLGWWLANRSHQKNKLEDEKKTAEAFDDAIALMKEELHAQIVSMRTFVLKMGTSEWNVVDLYFTERLDYIKSIDRATVTSYSIKLKGKEHSRKIHEMYNCLAVIESDSKRVHKIVQDSEVELKRLHSAFFEQLDLYAQTVSSHYNNGYPTDDYGLIIHKLFLKEVRDKQPISDYPALGASFFEPLLFLNDRFNDHPLVKSLNEIAGAALRIINRQQSVHSENQFLCTIITQTFEKCYLTLYEEPFKEEAKVPAS